VTIKAEGFREIDDQLANLGSASGTRILRTAMLRGARPMLEEAKANVAARKRGSGALHQALGMRFIAGNQNRTIWLPPLGGRFRVEITPFRKNRIAIALYNLFYKRRVSRLFYGHFVEFGFRHRGGKQIGPESFLLPALRSQARNVIATFARELRVGIDRELRRRARRK
jgi:hypothetical protein